MRRLGTILVAALMVAMGGCAYRLGPTNGFQAGSRSVQVNPFDNKTSEPRLIEAINFAMRRQLQQDGTFALDTNNEGDIVVTGTIVSYTRNSLSFQSRDVLTPRDYRITITAHVIARERGSGRTLLDRRIEGHSDIRVGPDLVSAERQALPLVAAALARNATALLVDGDF